MASACGHLHVQNDPAVLIVAPGVPQPGVDEMREAPRLHRVDAEPQPPVDRFHDGVWDGLAVVFGPEFNRRVVPVDEERVDGDVGRVGAAVQVGVAE